MAFGSGGRNHDAQPPILYREAFSTAHGSQTVYCDPVVYPDVARANAIIALRCYNLSGRSRGLLGATSRERRLRVISQIRRAPPLTSALPRRTCVAGDLMAEPAGRLLLFPGAPALAYNSSRDRIEANISADVSVDFASKGEAT